MGLVLSTFFIAIGIVEFLDLYANIVRHLRTAPVSPRLHHAKNIHNELDNSYDEGRSMLATPSNEFNEAAPDNNTRRRSSSPYPSFDLMAPRSSITPDFLAGSSISVVEVEEENYSDATNSRSQSPASSFEKVLQSTSFNSTQYWSNEGLRAPYRRSKSRSHSRSRSRSPDPRLRHSRSRTPYGSRTGIFRDSEKLMDVNLKRSNTPSPTPFAPRARSVSECERAEFSLTVPGVKRSSSNSDLVEKDFWKRSPSPFQKLLLEQIDYESEVEAETSTSFSTKEVHKVEESAKYFVKNDDIPTVRIINCSTELEDEPSVSTPQTENTLEEAAKILSEVKGGASREKYKKSKKKAREPFWVK